MTSTTAVLRFLLWTIFTIFLYIQLNNSINNYMIPLYFVNTFIFLYNRLAFNRWFIRHREYFIKHFTLCILCRCFGLWTQRPVFDILRARTYFGNVLFGTNVKLEVWKESAFAQDLLPESRRWVSIWDNSYITLLDGSRNWIKDPLLDLNDVTRCYLSYFG